MDNLTNFPNGISSGGVPQIGAGIPVTNGVYWFVDGTNGNDGNNGHSLAESCKTIAGAVNQAAINDIVLVLPGTYTEAVVVNDAGVRIIALGTAKKSVIWTSATDTITCSITAINVEIAGFYFKPPVYTANAGATSIQLGNAGQAYIHDNKFQGQTGSYNAIYSPICNSDNVRIENNDFEYMNTITYGAAILGVEAGGLSYSNWSIKGNKFNSCVTAVNINGRVCLAQGNHFGINGITALGAGAAVTTLALDFSGTSSYGNLVHGNYLGGTYSATLYKIGASGDDWAGNFNIAGITAANPA